MGDRAEVPHATNLFDIDAKYADVLPLDEVLESLQPPIARRSPRRRCRETRTRTRMIRRP